MSGFLNMLQAESSPVPSWLKALKQSVVTSCLGTALGYLPHGAFSAAMVDCVVCSQLFCLRPSSGTFAEPTLQVSRSILLDAPVLRTLCGKKMKTTGRTGTDPRHSRRGLVESCGVICRPKIRPKVRS